MNSRTNSTILFVISFVLGVILFGSLDGWFATERVSRPAWSLDSATHELVGQVLPVTDLHAKREGRLNADPRMSIPDTAVVILLGGLACSYSQVDLLRHWSKSGMDSTLSPPDIVAIYADPMMSIDQAFYELQVLRRVSQADFPFLVSSDKAFGPRLLGLPTPQVVLAISDTIVQVIDNPVRQMLAPARHD